VLHAKGARDQSHESCDVHQWIGRHLVPHWIAKGHKLVENVLDQPHLVPLRYNYRRAYPTASYLFVFLLEDGQIQSDLLRVRARPCSVTCMPVKFTTHATEISRNRQRTGYELVAISVSS